MVKNDAGGNKGKGLARKHVNAAKYGSSKQLRVATDAAERYAIVSKMLGNGMCYVRLLDGSTRDRLCIIRNKFKGRGKRDNILDSGSWVLVGLREWSSNQDTCDLLEVYNAAERDRLQKNEPIFKTVEVSNGGNSSNESNNHSHNHNHTNTNNSVQFADSTTRKYSSMLHKSDDADDSDGDGDALMQQRVYDMPPSDSDSDSDSDSEDRTHNQSESESEDEDEPEVPAVQVRNKPTPNKPCEINVDDI
jgi:initiation factor 1A